MNPETVVTCTCGHFNQVVLTVALIINLTVFKNSMTASTAGVIPGSAPNSDSSMRSRSSWSPV